MRSLVIEKLDENIAVKGFYTEYFREFCSHKKCYIVGEKVLVRRMDFEARDLV